MGDAARLRAQSEQNYLHLEREVRELLALAKELHEGLPSLPLPKQCLLKVQDILRRYFEAAVPVADSSVAVVLLEEKMKETQVLEEELNTAKEWLYSSAVVHSGNDYLNTLRVDLPEVSQTDRDDRLDTLSSESAVQEAGDDGEPWGGGEREGEGEWEGDGGRLLSGPKVSYRRSGDVGGPEVGRRVSQSYSKSSFRRLFSSGIRPSHSGRSLQVPLVVLGGEGEGRLLDPEQEPEHESRHSRGEGQGQGELDREVEVESELRPMLRAGSHLPSSRKGARTLSATSVGSAGGLFGGRVDRKGSYLAYLDEEDKARSHRLSPSPSELQLGEMSSSTTSLKLRRETTKLQRLKDSVRKLRELNENTVAIFHGVHKATAALLASMLFLFPIFSQYSVFPAWATITAYCTATTYAGSSLRRGLTEAVSSVLGSFIGFGTIYMVLFTGPDCSGCSYKPYLLGTFLWLTIFAFSYLSMKRPSWELAIEVGLISFIAVTAVEYLNPKDHVSVVYVLDRTAMITAGVVFAFLTSYLVFPVKGSRMIHQGLKNALATDIGNVLSGVMELYSDPEVVRGEISGRKRDLYQASSAVFSKTAQMKALIDTTKGEVVSLSLRRCRVGTFPAKKYTTIIFCANQLIYITITLFYGLQGEAANTAYCRLFKRTLDLIRLRFERMFILIAGLMDHQGAYLEITSHVQVIQTLLEDLERRHREHLDQGVAFSYTFDDVQAFSHLWSCLKLYLRKSSHLIHSIMSLHEG